jgi:hypothetical protein
VVRLGYTVIVPHTPLHEIRTALYKTLGEQIDDIVVLYDKMILFDANDYDELERQAKLKLSGLNCDKVALVLTGSYAACIIAYRLLKRFGFNIDLLQYDAKSRMYLILHDEGSSVQ